jgi:hypothetical protein
MSSLCGAKPLMMAAPMRGAMVGGEQGLEPLVPLKIGRAYLYRAEIASVVRTIGRLRAERPSERCFALRNSF